MLMTIPEVGAELRIDRATVYRLLRRGDLPLPLVRIGSSVRVRVADLERYLEQLAEAAEPMEKPTPAANGHPAGVAVSRRASRGSPQS
jgi:excisionase family DNA binding protein